MSEKPVTPLPAGKPIHMRLPLIVSVSVAVVLHLYTVAFKAQGGWTPFVIGLLAFSLAPYLVALALARFRVTNGFASGFATGALLGDVFMHYSVFIAPKGSTAALGLLFMPIWNLLLLGPIGALVSWAGGRLAGKNAA